MCNNPTYDSQDWIEDALDTLDKSRFQYILITCVGDNQMRLDGNLNREVLEDIAKGEECFDKMLRDFARSKLEEIQ